MTAVAGRRQSPARVTDRGRLAVDLAETLRGEVRFDRGAQAMYASDRGRPKGPRCCCGRTLSPTTSPQGSRPPACLKTPTAGSGYRSGPCAAAGFCTTTGCCRRPNAGCGGSWPSSASRSFDASPAHAVPGPIGRPQPRSSASFRAPTEPTTDNLFIGRKLCNTTSRHRRCRPTPSAARTSCQPSPGTRTPLPATSRHSRCRPTPSAARTSVSPAPGPGRHSPQPAGTAAAARPHRPRGHHVTPAPGGRRSPQPAGIAAAARRRRPRLGGKHRGAAVTLSLPGPDGGLGDPSCATISSLRDMVEWEYLLRRPATARRRNCQRHQCPRHLEGDSAPANPARLRKATGIPRRAAPIPALERGPGAGGRPHPRAAPVAGGDQGTSRR